MEAVLKEKDKKEIPYFDAVICVKDMEQFIEETIQNLLKADLPPKTIWVIDDGSTDKTAEKATAFEQVTVIKNGRNKGKSYSRNLGITSSEAPFIQLIDADDLIAPEKTRIQLDYLMSHPQTDAVYGDLQHFIVTPLGKEFRPILKYDHVPDMLGQLIQKNIYALHSFFFRRSYFEKAGLMDERLPTSQDRELWIRALLSGCKVDYLPGCLSFYRRHETSTIASQQSIVANFNAMSVSMHAKVLYYFKNRKYEELTRTSIRMLARNKNRYLLPMSEIDSLIHLAYSDYGKLIRLNQNEFYNALEQLIGPNFTERLLRPKFWLDHKLGRYDIKY